MSARPTRRAVLLAASAIAVAPPLTLARADVVIE
jgi:hypothetical protein